MVDGAISPRRHSEIIDALRRGTVPQQGPDLMAEGADSFESTIDIQLNAVKNGAAQFKAGRTDYGYGYGKLSRTRPWRRK